MVQRVQVVALAASVAIGAALVAGLTLGSRKAAVHLGPTTLQALDLVDVYATIVAYLAEPVPEASTSPRTVSVSRTIYDSCPSPMPNRLPPLCGRTAVGKLKPDIEAALYDALARQGINAVFAEVGDVHLHQVVTEPTGMPAADGSVAGRGNELKFHFKPVKGKFTLQNVTVEWIA
jgi:hypothetical protein